MHRQHWFKTIGGEKPESKVSDLEVYIIGVWPSSSNGSSEDDGTNSGPNEWEIPSDYDGLNAKFYDINLSDKTEYEEKSAIMVSDLVDIIAKIRNLAPKYMTSDKQNEFTKKLRDFLENEVAQSQGRDGEKRRYASILNGRFKIHGEVVRIELRGSGWNIKQSI
jgi:hypothetical protein